jgi:hypothetical protein
MEGYPVGTRWLAIGAAQVLDEEDGREQAGSHRVVAGSNLGTERSRLVENL